MMRALDTLTWLVLVSLAVCTYGRTLVNTNVIRTVDLTGLPFAREQVGVVIHNEASRTSFPTYKVTIPLGKAQRLSQLTVHERKSGIELPVTKDSAGGSAVYGVALRQALAPGEKLSLNIDALYVGAVEPRPKSVGQSDDQTWAWTDDAYVPSAYPTRKQKTVVTVRGDVVRVSGANATRGARSVVFAPIAEDVGHVEVVFRDNAEQLDAVYRREYFVSHWANDLHVKEHYAVRSLAPSGSFDKVGQMLAKYTGRRDNLVKTLLTKVPADARDFYFVDEIGNVSTSAVGRIRSGARVLHLRPRFPLAGGWNYTWWHGYSVSLSRYLKVDGQRHLLRVPFMGTLTASASQESEPATANAVNTAVRAYELQVTLPEGARHIDVRLPADSARLELRPTRYYFDSVGRTVVVVSHANVAPELAARHVVVSYDYSASALWLKPLAVASALFAVFMVASFASRMHYALPTGKKKKRE
ncbi:dolichyl-diphosphooligosaccharide--protein glycosyltransferase subunit 1 [Coemansia sp. BCRC 34301]|nr:dolichyl-diphosphooligosaccharide--protein glycosyltransferase subunit 1 [Coemansia sp. BCRC 34301]